MSDDGLSEQRCPACGCLTPVSDMIQYHGFQTCEDCALGRKERGMTTSSEINEIAAALAKAQGAMNGAMKDAANPFFKSKYADLASVWDACRGPLSTNGIAVIQSPAVAEMRVSMDTLMVHTSGQWIKNTLSCTIKDDTPQTIGSATTYLRRYALQSLVGVAAEDDDGEAAEGRSNGHAKDPYAAAPARPAGPLTVERVTEKPTSNKNVTKHIVHLSDGRLAGTIRKDVAKIAKDCAADHSPVIVETTESQYGTDLQSIKRMTEDQSDTPILVEADIPF